jgi:hypothetical protein
MLWRPAHPRVRVRQSCTNSGDAPTLKDLFMSRPLRVARLMAGAFVEH